MTIHENLAKFVKIQHNLRTSIKTYDDPLEQYKSMNSYDNLCKSCKSIQISYNQYKSSESMHLHNQSIKIIKQAMAMHDIQSKIMKFVKLYDKL